MFFFNIIVLTSANLPYIVIYHLDHPFFEQFKTNSDPWPWKKNRQEWMKLLKKSILLVGFNNLVLIPTVMCCSMVMSGWKSTLDFDIDNLPDAKTLFIYYIVNSFI